MKAYDKQQKEIRTLDATEQQVRFKHHFNHIDLVKDKITKARGETSKVMKQSESKFKKMEDSVKYFS